VKDKHTVSTKSTVVIPTADIPHPSRKPNGHDKDESSAPLYCLSAEKPLFGSILQRNEILDGVAAPLTLDDISPGHQNLFRAMREKHAAGKPFDADTMEETLRRRGQLKDLGSDDPADGRGIVYLSSLVLFGDMPKSDGILLEHVQTIKTYSARREAQHFVENFDKMAQFTSTTPEALASMLRSAAEQQENRADIRPQPEHRIPVAPVLSNDALYGFAGEVVGTLLPHTEASAASLLFHFLTFYGNIIGRHAWMQGGNDQHFTNLYYCACGLTSIARKGTAKSAVWSLYDRVEPDNWTHKCILGALSSGEGLIAAVADKEHEATDKRLMVILTELGGPLKILKRDGNTLSAVLRQFWESGDADIPTKRDPLHVRGAHMSLIAHITTDELRRLLDDLELGNGLANRILWGYSERSKYLPYGGKVDREKLLDLVIGLQQRINYGERAEEMQWDDGARPLWEERYRGLSEPGPGLQGAIVSRAAPQVLRMAMIHALLDQSQFVNKSHLKAALAAWDYCEATVKFVWGDTLGDPIADTILEALRKAPEQSLTLTEINRLFSSHRTSEARRALNFLEERGYAYRSKVASDGGRDAEWWHFGPQKGGK
jgi:hypothetical protein